MSSNDDRCVVVVGGGISGMSAAIDTAEAGRRVVLVERGPSLGGRVAGMHRYFPKICPPSCGLEINYRRIKANPRIEVIVDAELASVSGPRGDQQVAVRIAPRMVNERCTACDACVAACPVERPNTHNFGLDNTKAIYLPNRLAFPMRYAIDRDACPGASCGKCLPACPFGAIDLASKPVERVIRASSVVWATGWKPYDATRIQSLGFGRLRNVITNVMFERLAASDGPTGGKLTRPSDGKPARRVVFAQCAGSRDEEHLPYCSAVCCTASLKQACYVREADPEASVQIFYIDLRAGDNEEFLRKVQADPKVTLTKGKVGQVLEDPHSGELEVVVEDIEAGKRMRVQADLVVLATGLVPESRGASLPAGLVADEHGFLGTSADRGIEAVGCARHPTDVRRSVQDAMGASIRALQAQAAR